MTTTSFHDDLRNGVTGVTWIGEVTEVTPVTPSAALGLRLPAADDVARPAAPPTPEQWIDAVARIGKWLRGRGRPHDFGGHSVNPPGEQELGDADREEIEAAALEAWLKKRAACEAASPTRAAARALKAWRRRQLRRRGLGLAPLPTDEEGWAVDVGGSGGSVEDAALAAVDATRAARARPTFTRPRGKAAEGPGSRAVQADCFIRQCASGDPGRVLRWIRCLPAIAELTRLPTYGAGNLSDHERRAALLDIQAAIAADVGADAVTTARAVLRGLGCSPPAAKALSAHLRMRAKRNVPPPEAHAAK